MLGRRIHQLEGPIMSFQEWHPTDTSA
uniref:Uncharacterized protein n=1 Tax=Arundo donax TaxID=35708 RepID=A0A0A9G2K0_ARUDO